MTDTTAASKVCVVGAGIAGLVTAKTLCQDGFDVQVIERDSSVGGTWAPSRTYPGLRTNNSKQTYEFSDYSYPDSADQFPSAEQVRDYLESYANHFDLLSRIGFNQEVLAVSRASDDGDQIAVKYSEKTGSVVNRNFDFVAMCNGVYHTPSIPIVAGRDSFAGRIMHSSEVTDQSYGPGDKVVVVGGGKSAFDCATWAARREVNPILVYRRPQWMAPRFLPGGRIPGDWLVTSRLMALFLRYYHSGRFERIAHTVGLPLVRLWWVLISAGWTKDLKVPSELRPAERLPAGIEKVGVGGDFYGVVNEGSASARRGTIARFVENGIELDGGEHVVADVVIFATGWEQDLSFLSEDLKSEIAGSGYPRLFRQILPPTVPNLGFVGYASSFACQLTAEIGAHWLSEHFLGALRLPSVAVMDQEIDRAHAWAEKHLPQRGTECFIGPHISHYVDDLMVDMGVSTRRLDGFVGEYLTAFRASRFAGLTSERRRARESTA